MCKLWKSGIVSGEHIVDLDCSTRSISSAKFRMESNFDKEKTTCGVPRELVEEKITYGKQHLCVVECVVVCVL